MAARRPFEERQERAAAMHNAPEVDVHEPVEVLEGGVHGVTDQRHASIVDDQVHVVRVFGNGGAPGLNGRGISDVHAGRRTGHVRRHCSARSREARRIHIRDKKLAALLRETQGEGAADPGPGSGDSGAFA